MQYKTKSQKKHERAQARSVFYPYGERTDSFGTGK